MKLLNVVLLIIILITSISTLVYATTNSNDYFKDFTALYLVDDEIYLNETETYKIKVEVYGNNNILGISANFFSIENNESFNAKLEGKIGSTDTYLIIPNTVKPGARYEMMYVDVKSADGTITTYCTTSVHQIL